MGRSDVPRGEPAALPLGVGRASLTPVEGCVLVADDGGEVVVSQVVTVEEVLAGSVEPAHGGAIAVEVARMGRRACGSLDAPRTAERMSRLAPAVVLVTDGTRPAAVAGLASRLVDRNVRCWVATRDGAAPRVHHPFARFRHAAPSRS